MNTTTTQAPALLTKLPTVQATAQLAAFAAGLTFDTIPESVVRKTEDLLVDWFGSALAGKGARPVESIARFAEAMGTQTRGVALPAGSAEVLISRSATSPYLAAMVNAAASHVAEQDDVHNGSVFHPATVVFPAAVAVAQAIGARSRLPRLPEPTGERAGVVGRGQVLQLLVTGDSSAVGVGVGSQRDARTALAILRELVTAFDSDPALFEALGRAYQLSGDEVRAGEAYARATALRGALEDALSQLNMIAQGPSLTYYERARIDAQVAELTPIVLEIKRRDGSANQRNLSSSFNIDAQSSIRSRLR